MPAMLGAQLEDLLALAGELTRTTSAIGETQTSSTSTSDEVVESVRRAADSAERQITGQMDALRAAVARASTSADSAVWTGANAERFRAASREFDTSMQRAEDSTRATFADFRTAIGQMAEALAQYAQSLATALANAQNSTESMRAAVDAQAANLDQVMNTGLTVG